MKGLSVAPREAGYVVKAEGEAAELLEMWLLLTKKLCAGCGYKPQALGVLMPYLLEETGEGLADRPSGQKAAAERRI